MLALAPKSLKRFIYSVGKDLIEIAKLETKLGNVLVALVAIFPEGQKLLASLVDKKENPPINL